MHCTRIFTALFSGAAVVVSVMCSPNAHADVGPYETAPVSRHSFSSPDKTSLLTVSLERIDREKIRQVDKGAGKAPEAWLGKRKLPAGVLWRRPTLISSFSLTIDGKKINIPARFWNDLVGFDLRKIIVNKKPTTAEERWKLEEFTQAVRNPKISRSRDGGTVMISWIRPEE